MKKIVEKLSDMGLITYMGVDTDKFKNVEELIDSGVITAIIDRNKLYEIIGQTPVETPIVEEPKVLKPTIEESIVTAVSVTAVTEDTVSETINDIVVDEESTTEPMEEPAVEEKPKTKKTNKKS